MVAQESCTLALRRRSPRPTTTTGTLLWSKDTALKARNECRAILCPELEGAVSGETAWIPLVKAARVTTTDAVLTLAYSYAIPAHTIGDIEIVILGKCNATGDWTRVKETGAIDRFWRQRDLDGLNAGSPAVRRDVDIHHGNQRRWR